MPLFINGQMPTSDDVERLKLLLSTFTDGSGENGEGDLPGGFNFERVAAEWLNGIHIPGTKHIYDVVVKENGRTYGYSCKMRNTLNDAEGRHGDCTIEVSNASAAFTAIARKHGVSIENIEQTSPETLKLVGEEIIGHIEGLHHNATARDGTTYESGSIMLHLAWSDPKTPRATKKNPNPEAIPSKYKLFVFDKHIATPAELPELVWSPRMGEKDGQLRATLIGQRKTTVTDQEGKTTEVLVRAVEIYLYSGGHVKYYPRATDAIWTSGEPFDLRQAPRQKHVLSAKAHGYWPEEWEAAGGELPGDRVTAEVSEAAAAETLPPEQGLNLAKANFFAIYDERLSN